MRQMAYTAAKYDICHALSMTAVTIVSSNKPVLESTKSTIQGSHGMDRKTKYLKGYLIIFGLLNIFVISFTIPWLLGDLLLWSPRNIPVEMMMSSIYLVMGGMMLRINKDPMPHQGFIDFIVIANLAHALVMVIYAENIWHILFDAGVIALMGCLPLFFYPWGLRRFWRY